MTQTIRLDISPPVAEIVLNQPNRRNALSLDMWASLRGRVAEANADPAIKVILLHGGGDGVFAAGADISEFPVIYADGAASRASGRTVARALEALEQSAKPVIAAIEGACVGGGVSLAVACDLRLAAASATFGITPAKLGLMYPPADILRLVRLVGPGTAKRLLYTGSLIPGEEALRIGLIDQIASGAGVIDAARSLAQDIAAQSQWTVRATKTMIADLTAGLDPASPEAEDRFIAGFANPDFAEGVSAFLSKRRPDWKVP